MTSVLYRRRSEVCRAYQYDSDPATFAFEHNLVFDYDCPKIMDRRPGFPPYQDIHLGDWLVYADDELGPVVMSDEDFHRHWIAL